MRKVSVIHEIMSMQHVWNGADREIWSNRREICHFATLFTRNPTCLGCGFSPGFRDEGQAEDLVKISW